jgi:mono/diheme cytochrome c family protein
MIARWGLGAVMALLLPLFALAHAQRPASMPVLSETQTQFLLRCGGCHGTQGVSPPQSVPVLRERAGWFLCTPAGREYLVRVPNVSRALLDDQALARMLNFVTFDLGRAPLSHQPAPFTAEEVAAIRRHPANDAPLIAYRTKVVKQLIAQCGAPRDLLDYGRAGAS